MLVPFRVFGLTFIAALSLATPSSTFAQHHHHGGHSGYGGHGGYGGAIYGPGHFSHGHGHGYSGIGHSGLGYGYGGIGSYNSLSIGRGGFSLSIGSVSPYGLGYDPYSYGGLGYSGFDLGRYGYGATALPYSGYSGYSSAYRYSPYYSARSSFDLQYDPIPPSGLPGIQYDGSTNSLDNLYGVPGYYSDFRHQPSVLLPSDAAAMAQRPELAPADELRPGMILPDGSKVISVGPIEAPATEPADEAPAPAGDAASI